MMSESAFEKDALRSRPLGTGRSFGQPRLPCASTLELLGLNPQLQRIRIARWGMPYERLHDLLCLHPGPNLRVCGRANNQSNKRSSLWLKTNGHDGAEHCGPEY